MKSALSTLLILIILFIAANSGAFNLLSNSMFHYISIIALVVVFAFAAFFIGFTDKNPPSQISDNNQQEDNADEK